MPCPNYRRKQTISKAFRVSREESERIELLAKATGVTQQEYIMVKIEDKEFTVVPDIRTYKMLRDTMRQVYQELCRLRDCSTVDERLIAKIELLSDLFVDIAGDASRGELEKEDNLIAEMKRRQTNNTRTFTSTDTVRRASQSGAHTVYRSLEWDIFTVVCRRGWLSITALCCFLNLLKQLFNTFLLIVGVRLRNIDLNGSVLIIEKPFNERHIIECYGICPIKGHGGRGVSIRGMLKGQSQ